MTVVLVTPSYAFSHRLMSLKIKIDIRVTLLEQGPVAPEVLQYSGGGVNLGHKCGAHSCNIHFELWILRENLFIFIVKQTWLYYGLDAKCF